MKDKLAIFDLDGTLFDTFCVNYESYHQSLSEFGFELERKYFEEECYSRNYKVFLPSIVGQDSVLIEQIHKRKIMLYPQFLNKASENTHLFNIIKSIQSNYFTAIATTATRQNTEDILSCFNKLDLFDLIVTGEDVKKTKPDPECFLKVMEHFKASAKDTMIFEDSKIGIQAALSTGASVFSVSFFV